MYYKTHFCYAFLNNMSYINVGKHEILWGKVLLGPTLFLCFINDLELTVDVAMTARGEQKRYNLKKFADDTKWGAVVESAEDRAEFQEGLDNLPA